VSTRKCPKCREPFVQDAHDDWHCGECGFVPDPDEFFALDVRTAREISALPEPDESDMLVGPLVVRGARTIIVADTGHGKTTLAMQLASAALSGWEVFGYFGAHVACVLVVDLEQGIRSIKRTLREAGLAEREDVLYVASPDGLALDSDEEHREELGRIVEEHRPAIVLLDPYYKAHRGDSNEERGVTTDTMRYLDGLRARYGFALILPAHPRKDQTGRDGARKLKLDDVAGSGAVTRGAELAFALERLSHGFARLRILKDRDGDLTVGEEWPLLFTRGEGFRLDPKAEETEEDLEQRILELGADGSWRTYKEYAGELGVRQTKAKQMLEALAESDRLEVAIGPAGRSPKPRSTVFLAGAAIWPSFGLRGDEPAPAGGVGASGLLDGIRREISASAAAAPSAPLGAEGLEAQSGSGLVAQASSGIARSRTSAWVKLSRQGQRAGRWRVERRALRVIRPGDVR